MTEPTICSRCDHLHPDTRKQPMWRWLCMRHKRLPRPNYLTDDPALIEPPFLRCVDVNGGICELFEPQRKED